MNRPGFGRAALCTGLMCFPAIASAAPPVHDTPPQSVSQPSEATTRLAVAMQMMLVSQNLCMSYAYDTNGNRTTQTSGNVTTTGPVWGTSVYPCFIWSAN